MKSGQMDSLALWGQPTVFIEDVGSVTIGRSKLWAKPDKDSIQRGAFVQSLPTMTGKAVQTIRQENTKKLGTTIPKLEETVGPTKEKLKAGGVTKGFVDDDLTRIENEIKAAFELAVSMAAARASAALKPLDESSDE